jgi:aspartyl-tRNA(Asn)/glutamyl-tRNA(Gln) amidotransferase subunit C
MDAPETPSPAPLTDAEIRKIATLARLELTDEQVASYRVSLGSVLGYMQILRRLNLEGVEPLSHPTDAVNRLDDDTAGPTLTTAQFMAMAPASMPPFLKVPKVLGGDAGGACGAGEVRVPGSGFRVPGSGFRVPGSGSRILAFFVSSSLRLFVSSSLPRRPAHPKRQPAP